VHPSDAAVRETSLVGCLGCDQSVLCILETKQAELVAWLLVVLSEAGVLMHAFYTTAVMFGANNASRTGCKGSGGKVITPRPW
jgi:hypothetical protein